MSESNISAFLTSIEELDPYVVGVISDLGAFLAARGRHIRVFGNGKTKRGAMYRVQAISTDWALQEIEPTGSVWIEASFIKPNEERVILVRDLMYSEQNDAQDNAGSQFYYDLELPRESAIQSIQITVASTPAGNEVDAISDPVTISIGESITPFIDSFGAAPVIDTMHLQLPPTGVRFNIGSLILNNMLTFR